MTHIDTDYIPMVQDTPAMSSFVRKPIWFFLDDEREPPSRTDRHWVIFRTGEDMIAMIEAMGVPDGISFDHDLGAGMTGDDAAQALVGMALNGTLVFHSTFDYDVHSQNCVGAKNIFLTMRDFMRISFRGLEN